MLYNLQVWCLRHLFFSTNTTHIFKKHQELVSVYSFKKKRSHSLHQFQNQMRPWMLFCQKPGDVTFWLDSNLNEISSQRLGWKVRPPQKNTAWGPGSTKRKRKTSLLDPKCPWKMKVLSPPKYGLQPLKKEGCGFWWLIPWPHLAWGKSNSNSWFEMLTICWREAHYSQFSG